ncbi:hypothetical protein FKM82_010118 [Ascaphus truei]
MVAARAVAMCMMAGQPGRSLFIKEFNTLRLIHSTKPWPCSFKTKASVWCRYWLGESAGVCPPWPHNSSWSKLTSQSPPFRIN